MKSRLSLIIVLILFAPAGVLVWKFFPTENSTTTNNATVAKLSEKTTVAALASSVENPKAASAKPADVAPGPDPLFKKQADAETMRQDMENTLAQVRQTIDAEIAQHPEQRASLEAQFAQIRQSMGNDLADTQGPTTDWGEIEFTDSEPVQKFTVNGQLCLLTPSPGADGMINVLFSINPGAKIDKATAFEKSTRSLPGYPMTVQAAGGVIKFIPKWKAGATAANSTQSASVPSP